MLRALTPPVVPAGWRIGSFSSLRSASVETQAADADAADHDVIEAFEVGEEADRRSAFDEAVALDIGKASAIDKAPAIGGPAADGGRDRIDPTGGAGNVDSARSAAGSGPSSIGSSSIGSFSIGAASTSAASTSATWTGATSAGTTPAGTTPAGAASAHAPPAGDDFLDFPRGPSAGDCLHAVFERLDFTDPATAPAAIAQALQRFPQSLPGVAADEAQATLARMLQRAVDDVLSTRLPTGFRLRDIGRRDRLIELGFHLPAPRISAAALERLLRDHGMPGPRLVFGSLAGYLTGFIDLVVRHRGRYYLVDWKSNHLGHRPADYAGPNLARAMDERGYHLQYALYSVALDRLLRRRVTGYDTARDFGGVLYLFARGMRPGWVDRDGQPTGVSFHRPSVAFIRTLDDLIAGGVEEGAR